MPRMTRLAGIAAVYALIAALLLVTPLSASEDPEPQHAAPIDTVAQSEAAAPETPEPEPTAPEAVAPEAAPPEATAPSDPPATSEPPPPQAPAPAPEPAASTPAAEDPAAPAPRATAAADTSVTISDFQFAPASITIDAGDTVTWINEGPTPHSATADDGSFDTGIQDQGGSASHTFDEAGSFSYFCTPHPNMRGSVTVRAASTGGGSGGGGAGDAGGATGGESGAAGTGTGSSGDSSGAALPATGLDSGGLAVLGLVTLALGAWLRRRSAAAG